MFQKNRSSFQGCICNRLIYRAFYIEFTRRTSIPSVDVLFLCNLLWQGNSFHQHISSAKGMHKGTSEASVLSESVREHRSKDSLYGAKTSVSGSRCNLLREDSGLRKQKIHRTLNEFCGSFYLSLFTQFRLVVDQLIFVAPAVQFSDFFSNLFSLMLCSFLSHSLEVYLTSCW